MPRLARGHTDIGIPTSFLVYDLLTTLVNDASASRSAD